MKMSVLIAALVLAMMHGAAAGAEKFTLFTYSSPVPTEFARELEPTFWINGAVGWHLAQPFRSDSAWPLRAPPSEILKATLEMMARDRSQLIILDGEVFPFDKRAKLLNNFIDMRNKFRPDAKIAAYGFWPTDANRDEVIQEARTPGANEAAHKRILGSDDLQQFEKRWDVVTIDVYLIGEKFFDRDIQFIESSCKLAGTLEALKGKPIFLTVRGSWPDAKGQQVPIADAQLAKYAQTIRTNAAGAIVFDPLPQDHKFIEMLKGN